MPAPVITPQPPVVRGLPRVGSGLELLWDPTRYFARARKPEELLFGRRVTPHQLFGRELTESYLSALGDAMTTEIARSQARAGAGTPPADLRPVPSKPPKSSRVG